MWENVFFNKTSSWKIDHLQTKWIKNKPCVWVGKAGQRREAWEGGAVGWKRGSASRTSAFHQRTQTRAAQRRGSTEGRQGGQVNSVHSPSRCWLWVTHPTPHPDPPTSDTSTPQSIASGPRHKLLVWTRPFSFIIFIETNVNTSWWRLASKQGCPLTFSSGNTSARKLK